MVREELREDWMEFVESRLGEDLTPKGRLRKDHLSQAFGRKTEGEVFDRPTMMALYKLINQNVLATLDYPLSTGKEANVFHATDPAGRSVAVKIFRVHTATFQSYLTYIQGDQRFQNIKGDRRSIIHLWVRKEYTNLLRLHDVGLRVPQAIVTEANLLLMTFIGEDGTPAPLMKDVVLKDPQACFEELVQFIETAWVDAKLVHGDLSEYNVMVQPAPEGGDLLTVIDVGQAVLRNHPMAKEFLARDAKNVARFFGKLGVETDPEALVARLVKRAEEGPPEPAAGEAPEEEKEPQ